MPYLRWIYERFAWYEPFWKEILFLGLCLVFEKVWENEMVLSDFGAFGVGAIYSGEEGSGKF